MSFCFIFPKKRTVHHAVFNGELVHDVVFHIPNFAKVLMAKFLEISHNRNIASQNFTRPVLIEKKADLWKKFPNIVTLDFLSRFGGTPPKYHWKGGGVSRFVIVEGKRLQKLLHMN